MCNLINTHTHSKKDTILLIGHAIRILIDAFRHEVCYNILCVCVCFLPIHSGHQVRSTYQPGSHRRKVTQDFSSSSFLRCMPLFFSREGFGHSFPSSIVKSNFVYSNGLIVLHT